MPLRKRERFERTDVPEASPYRNVVGAIVCVVALAATALVVSLVWQRVSLESRLGDVGLTGALSGQAASDVTEGTSYVASADEHETVLLLTTDSLDGGSLSAVRILDVNRTQGTAVLANVPVATRVTSNDAAYSVADLYAASGGSACVAPLAQATGAGFDHVVVATGDVVEEAAAIAGTGASDLVRSASDLLSKIRTDMDATGLLALAEALSSVGTANISVVEAPAAPETVTDEEGNATETGLQLVDRVQLCAALGLIVPAA